MDNRIDKEGEELFRRTVRVGRDETILPFDRRDRVKVFNILHTLFKSLLKEGP